MKIFAAGILTETNTFSPNLTGLEDFFVQRGKGNAEGQGDASAWDLPETWGKWAAAQGDEFVFSLMAFAQPSGLTVKSAYESLRDEMLADLKAAMPVDIVLLMLHGAMVAQGYDDCEEDIIQRVRDIVGPDVVIGVELDLHCHLSPSKIAPANLVVIYKEYPHFDINDRAREVFDLAVATKLGKIRPMMALFDCRMIGLYPTTTEPLRGFVDAMTEAEKRKGVLSISFGHGFQFADVPHVGAKVLVVTDHNPGLAEETAREFGLKVYGLRHKIGFESLSLPMNGAMSKAITSNQSPVVVADQSDNVGAGAPGDLTFVLRWLLDQKAEDAALAIFYDPEVVKMAKKAGAGASLGVRLGGKMGAVSGDPVDLEVTVLAVREHYLHAFPQESGEDMMFFAGDVAALRHGTIDIVVSSERCQCVNPKIFEDLGIDPKQKRILIAKSIQHFAGAFAPIAAQIVYMAAPGAVPPDPRVINYRRMDVSRVYPWVPDPLAVG